MPDYTLPFCLITAIIAFFAGAIVQQDLSFRNLNVIMSRNPYAYICRSQIFEGLSLLGTKRKYETVNKENPCHQSLSKCMFNLVNRGVQIVIRFLSILVEEKHEGKLDESSLIADIMKYGFPSFDNIHVHRNYVLSYDSRNRLANWVCEHLCGECIAAPPPEFDTTKRSNSQYIVDTTIDAMFRSKAKDFVDTSWVGAQLAASANHRCDPVGFRETYLLSNIVPQTPGLRKYVWLRLEKYVRQLALQAGSIYVYSGPLYMPQRLDYRNWAIRYHVIGMNTVSVPTHFFKVVIREHKNPDAIPTMEGYVVPNVPIDEQISLNSYLANIRDIEHFAGLKFYDGLRNEVIPDQLQKPLDDPKIN